MVRCDDSANLSLSLSLSLSPPLSVFLLSTPIPLTHSFSDPLKVMTWSQKRRLSSSLSNSTLYGRCALEK